MVTDNFLLKYWVDDDIKDCSNNCFENDLNLSINDIDLDLNELNDLNNKKLKDDYDNSINLKDINVKSKYRNSTITENHRFNENISNTNRSNSNRYKNKNNRTFNPEETYKYINLQGSSNKCNNHHDLYIMSTSCRVSKQKSKNILLDPCSKPRIKNII